MDTSDSLEAAPAFRPRPFLKWVGGKRQLLAELISAVDSAGAFERYHEPFLGGGALFFELCALGRLGSKPAWLSDMNARLIETYLAVRVDPEAVIRVLEVHAARHGQEHYYAVRASVPDSMVERAARMIYLNRTCFNGLYRENARGQFNVPMGRYKNPRICDEGRLRAAGLALRQARIECAGYDSVINRARSGDLVYFDPPYHPMSRTASFTSYTEGGFSEGEQSRLADVFAELDRMGVRVMLSNSQTPLVEKLYRRYRISKVLANRAVNSRADRRGRVPEALVINF